MKSYYILILATFFPLLLAFAIDFPDPPDKPVSLSVNFLTKSGEVFLSGYPVEVPLQEAVIRRENFQFPEIGQKVPFFGWTLSSENKNTNQSAYRILVASSHEKISMEEGDMWDSGKTESSESVNVAYNGSQLEPGRVYFWKVKIWDNSGAESPYSKICMFKTAEIMQDYHTARYPLQKQDELPVTIETLPGKPVFIDFGKAAFGRLRLMLEGIGDEGPVTVHLGESKKGGMVDPKPGGSIRYSVYKLKLKKGWNTYTLVVVPDRRNTGPQAILMPAYTGEVTPFRYCSIENYNREISRGQVVRETVFYPFDEDDSSFSSSDTVLNRIWELSKYSMKATSFAGIYVDGDRERIPYEADAYINQLGQFCVAREYSMGRYSHEYLIYHPTWPTEWIMQSVLMAWNDYMYTGNDESLRYHYHDLKAKTLMALAREDGLISTRTGKVTPEVLESIHFRETLRDIVDWPQKGRLGLGKDDEGETDGFEFQDINTVVNAYHYKALITMSEIAGVVGNASDKAFFDRQAELVRSSFNRMLFDKKRGVYTDGIGTSHASLHGNMFPLAFGLVSGGNVEKVCRFIRSRGMACSVYGSQFLLDALYEAGEAEYALQLLSSTAVRSWYNMIRAGSTIAMEAWDNKYKPNQDWNHAWGAAPANLIPRKLMGIEPLEPGFRKIRIKPQPATLDSASIQMPTIRGPVRVSFMNKPEQRFYLKAGIPANSSATVWLPLYRKKQSVKMDGQPVSYTAEVNFAVIDNVGSGNHTFEVVATP